MNGWEENRASIENSIFIHILLYVIHSYSSFTLQAYFFRGDFLDHSALTFTSSRSPYSLPYEALTKGC